MRRGESLSSSEKERRKILRLFEEKAWKHLQEEYPHIASKYVEKGYNWNVNRYKDALYNRYTDLYVCYHKRLEILEKLKNMKDKFDINLL